MAEKHYTCEICIPTARTLAGYGRDETYFLPRSQIGYPSTNADRETPLTNEQITQILFPQREGWKQELESADGDKWESAKHFLDKVLPFFADVMIQDGIYWVQNHPNNDAKVLMVDVLEKADINYSQWARSKVEEVKQLVTRRNVRVNAEGMNLNEQRLTQKLEVVERQMGLMVKSINALQRTILETNAGRNAHIGRAGGANGYNDDGHDDDDDDGTGGGAGGGGEGDRMLPVQRPRANGGGLFDGAYEKI